MTLRSSAWALLLVTGCAREVQPVSLGPPLQGEDSPWMAPGYARPPAVSARSDSVLATSTGMGQLPAGRAEASHPNVGSRPGAASADILGGETCLRQLHQAGVPFRAKGELLGVRTPLVVSGPIGGIGYHANGNLPLVCDCRLVLALVQIAPLMRQAGVAAIRFSGAYSYRRTRSGRLSLHAHGLALDVHEFVVGRRRLSVERDYLRGLSPACTPTAPVLNRLACVLRSTGLFRELLTPDSNRDHHDHFHLAIAPEPEAPANPGRLVVAR